MALDLETLKRQANVSGEDDDAVLGGLLTAAKAFTTAQLGFALDDEIEFPAGLPADVEQAILMLAAHWYENREATIVGVAAQSIPFGYEDVIRNHRAYLFG